MGIFDRFRKRPSHEDRPTYAEPPARGECSCPEHVEDLLETAIPYTAEMAEELGDEPMTVGDLVECDALAVRPNDADSVWLNAVEDGRGVPDRTDGPFQWQLWVGDEARAHYDDEADLQLDASLLAQPGLDRVVWEDREVFHVGATGLCESGVLAAAVRALADPRVRVS